MVWLVCLIFTIITEFQLSLQTCPEEVFDKGMNVTWPKSSSANGVESNPLCYFNESLVTRDCNNSEWKPPLEELKACSKVFQYFNLSACPPGFYPISPENNDYCYKIGSSSSWDFPCFKSGGASVITDFNVNDLESLLHSLNNTQSSKYFWLPARRTKHFNPVIWYIPGSYWGRIVEQNNILKMTTSIFKNCLLLDVEQKIITTETCTMEYPSLCFYINDLHYPAKCLNGYHAFRFLPDEGVCLGIEKSEYGLTYNDFVATKCRSPMSSKNYGELSRFIYKKVAELYGLPDNTWCWFKSSITSNNNSFIEGEENYNQTGYQIIRRFEGVINNLGAESLLDSMTTLHCMACESEMIYRETELLFEYSETEDKLYLTIYFPSGLWKYDRSDLGIQCFSNAKGFVKVIDIEHVPFIKVVPTVLPMNSTYIEKLVYIVNTVSDRSAQYWCEGHTKNFTLIETTKVIVNPYGNEEHVFSLVVKSNYPFYDNQNNVPDMTTLISDITKISEANKVLVMDILECTLDHMLVLIHLHKAIDSVHGDKGSNLLNTFNNLKSVLEIGLLQYNYTFVNLSSSLYCLPTTSKDIFILDWELTSITHIAAPKQFCLQANGLPVKRHCHGSYLLGGIWGDVEGYCDKNYEPSMTTKLLYKFAKGQVSDNFTTRFLIDGLNLVLTDINSLIPADIYYLSMSLKHITNIVQQNFTSVDVGDVNNIAWAMDRVMDIDGTYLRLAQTLNSTNVILDSINDIIEILAQNSKNFRRLRSEKAYNTYQLAIKPQFIVQISFPYVNNITGVAMSKKTSSSNFSDMIIRPLYKNATIDDVLSIENLEIATWMAEDVLNSLVTNLTNTNNDENDNKKDLCIVTNIFNNDAMFQELDANKHNINSRIVGVSVPGYMSNLKDSMSLIFRDIADQSGHKKFCGYWNFDVQKAGDVPGYWSKKGCYLVRSINNLTVCECYHLTHFGQLLQINNNQKDESKHLTKNHIKALNIITLVGSFLSLVGVVGIWITAIVFRSWRKKAGTKMLLQLSTSISLPLICLTIFNLDTTIFVENEGKYVVSKDKKKMCIALGVLLHYSTLASFTWMLITAILQFVRYVRVLGVTRPSRFMIKYTLIGWGAPLFPVILVLALDMENYIPGSSFFEPSRICYPTGLYFILCVFVPICIILIVNVALFLIVIYSISRRTDGKMRTTDLDLLSSQLRLSVILFFLLGLTWLFGIFSFTSNLIWSYLFCLTSTLQDFILFVYFVICDPVTRNLWLKIASDGKQCQRIKQRMLYKAAMQGLTYSEPINMKLLTNKHTQNFYMQCVVMKVYVPKKYLFKFGRLPVYYCQGTMLIVMLNTIQKFEVHEFYFHSTLKLPVHFVYEFYHPPPL